ncbi:MAG: hypothetical protein IH987_09050 [Planctomycetes bacterium]|nr:hypothetical protein [Planctomycetota bacterium]
MKRSGVGRASVWIVASAMTAGSTSVTGEMVLRTVALSGDPAPDTGAGVVFDHFNSAEIVINDAGQVAFRSVLVGPGVNSDNDRGIWSEGNGALSLVAREGSPAPGTAAGVEFSGVLDPFLSDDGTVGFYGFLRDPGVNLDENHIGIWSGPPGDLSLIARLGTQAPGLDPGTNFGVFNTPAYGHFGEAAYFSLLSGTGVDGTNFRSIWSEDMGSPRLVARMGSAPPDTNPGVVFENFGFPVINGAGQSAFHAT